MEIEPDDRFGTVDEFIEALVRASLEPDFKNWSAAGAPKSRPRLAASLTEHRSPPTLLEWTRSKVTHQPVQDGREPFVPVFYATDRATLPSKKGLWGELYCYGSKRDEHGQVRLGRCRVTIPDNHRIGRIESHKRLRLQFRSNPKKHITLHSANELADSEFHTRSSFYAGAQGGKAALVFVHGYNVSFRGGVLRLAQLAHDLEFGGVPILYSWPSQASVRKYLIDEANVSWSTQNLEGFLIDLLAKSWVDTVHVFAHSMGSRAAMNALRAIALRAGELANSVSTTPEGNSRVREVVFAAPDVDGAEFMKKSADIASISRQATLYSSSRDKALAASRRIHGWSRAGESGEHLVITEHVHTIDASRVDTSELGHGVATQVRAVIQDLALLLARGDHPDKRFGLRRVGDGTRTHWEFKP